MKSAIATVALAILYLSAGGFAGHNNRAPRAEAFLHGANVTVIEKNQSFSVLDDIRQGACGFLTCTGA